MAPEPAMLVVGAPGVGRRSMLRALQASQPPQSAAGRYVLALDTKYYTADVLLDVVDALAEQLQQQQLEPQLQALVLVFDASQQASFDSVRAWADARDTQQLELKLVVANKADLLEQQRVGAAAAPARPAWLDGVQEWCCDGCWELVEAAACQPELDARLWQQQEQGLPRVLAALQAHMWPGLVRKQRPAVAPAACAGHTHKGTQQQQQQQQRHAQPSAAAAAGPPSAEQEQPGNGAGRAAQPQEAAIGVAAAAGGASSDDEEGSSLQGGLQPDDFEQLLKQAQGMREQLAGLPDAQRRAAAAHMAMRLAAMLGLDGDEGSEDG